MGNMPVIKDLIVDMDAVHWKKIQRVTPWLLAKQPVPEREYVVPRESMVDVTQSMACIQCGACVSDCLAMEVDPDFIGPAALAKAYRFVGDPRDAAQRERLVDLAEDPQGIYDCTHCFKCVEACPKDVNPMGQIMRLRRIAVSDQHIVDANNGERHEAAFTTLVRDNGLLHEAELLPRSYGGNSWFGKFHPAAGEELLSLAAHRDQGDRCAARSSLKLIAVRPQAPQAGPQGGAADLRDRREPAGALRAEPLHLRRGRGRRAERRSRQRERRRWEASAGGRRTSATRRERRTDEGRLLARLREPRLHPRAARLDGTVAPLLDIELVAARPRQLLRRGRDRRAQPGARRHAQRAHLRARPAGRRGGADDEHLLDLPGRAERVPGAPRRERRVPRARQRDARPRGPLLREGPHQQELPVAARRGDRPRRAALARQAPADQPQGRPVLRLLHRAPARAPRHRRRAPARPLPRAGDRGARRHRDRVRRHAQVLRLPDHHDEQGGLAQAGRPPPRRRASTPTPTASSRRARCAT